MVDGAGQRKIEMRYLIALATLACCTSDNPSAALDGFDTDMRRLGESPMDALSGADGQLDAGADSLVTSDLAESRDLEQSAPVDLNSADLWICLPVGASCTSGQQCCVLPGSTAGLCSNTGANVPGSGLNTVGCCIYGTESIQTPCHANTDCCIFNLGPSGFVAAYCNAGHCCQVGQSC